MLVTVEIRGEKRGSVINDEVAREENASSIRNRENRGKQICDENFRIFSDTAIEGERTKKTRSCVNYLYPQIAS